MIVYNFNLSDDINILFSEDEIKELRDILKTEITSEILLPSNTIINLTKKDIDFLNEGIGNVKYTITLESGRKIKLPFQKINEIKKLIGGIPYDDINLTKEAISVSNAEAG